MIVAFYARTIDELLVRPFWAVRIWAHRHPIPFRLLVLVCAVVFMIGWPTLAFAADDSPISMLPGTSITDSAGTPVWRYTMLPLDRGNGLDGKVLVTGPLDFLWACHVFVVSWMVWLCDWVISFAWVDWIAQPFLAIANIVQNMFSRLNWIPLALAISGGVGMTMVVIGRHGKGIGELVISAICAILAVGFFANPVASITEDGGMLDTVQEYGGQLAAVIVTDDTSAVDQDPQTALQDSVTGELVDIFIRTPAQVLSFGRPLEGGCASTFDDMMKGGNDWSSGFLGIPTYGEVTIDDARDAVRDCDASAKSFNENPNFLSVITMVTVNQGSLSIFFLPLALFFLFVMAVMGGLWAGLKTMWHVFWGILPINRSALWRSALDTLIGVASIVLLTVFLAGALRFTGAMMTMIASAGIPLVVQMGVVQVTMLVLVFMLIRAKIQAKRAGRTLAEQLARFGANGGAVAPKQNMAAAVIGGGVATALINGGSKILAAKATRPPMHFDGRSINLFGGGGGNPEADNSPMDLSPAPTTPMPGGGSSSGGGRTSLPRGPQRPQLPAGGGNSSPAATKATRGARLAGSAARIAAGASGGVPGVAAAAGKEAVKGVAKKAAGSAVKSTAGKVSARPHPTAPAIALPPSSPSGGSSRISVDSSGVARVAPHAASRSTVYDISSLPSRRPTRSESGQRLRDRLHENRVRPVGTPKAT